MTLTRALIAAVVATALLFGVLLTACGTPTQAPATTPQTTPELTPPVQETTPQDQPPSQPPVEPEPEAPPETPQSGVDWSRVEILEVSEHGAFADSYFITYKYRNPVGPRVYGWVTVKKDCSQETIRAAIEQNIPERLAEMAEHERLKKEIEETFEGGGNE